MKILFDPKDELTINENSRLVIRDKIEGQFILTQPIKKMRHTILIQRY